MRSMIAQLLAPVRNGDREVAWLADWERFGNQLSAAYWAYLGLIRGQQRFVLRLPQQWEVLEMFPRTISTYFLNRSQVKFTDRRVSPWPELNKAFDWNVLRGFITGSVLPDSKLPEVKVADNTLVINVRRGDFYSSPVHRAELGYNVPAYVTAAVRAAIDERGKPSKILVISDDIGWCEGNIGRILSDTASVSYGSESDAQRDLATIVAAKRLIVPNSSFSLWGGHIGDIIAPGRQVIAPLLYARNDPVAEERWPPWWTVVQNIEGGWGAPS